MRRFGLFGTRHELRIDVLQIVPIEVGLAAYRWDDDRGRESLPADAPRHRAPELRTVCYTFNKRLEINELESLHGMSTDDEAHMEEALLGLVREEMDFETRIDGGSMLWVPEVMGLEFRYFDGSGWRSQWDSIKLKSLPVAVEVRLEISTDEIRLHAEQEANQARRAQTGPPDYETYRLVVELPSANLHKGPRKPAAQTAAALARPRPLATPRLDQSTLPPPSSKKPLEDKKASEQWMRTNPQ